MWLAGEAIFAASTARPKRFWLPTGYGALRDDIALLMDEGVYGCPLQRGLFQWLTFGTAVERVDGYSIGSECAALRGTLLRCARVGERPDAKDWLIRQISATVGKEGLLREYGARGTREDSLGRGRGERSPGS